MTPNAPIVILGGGISGLSAAYYLYNFGSKRLAAEGRKIILLESSSHLGGWLQSRKLPNDTIHEVGPNSLRIVGNAGKNTLQLIDFLGLDRAVLPSNSEMAGRRMVYATGQMCHLPKFPWGLFIKKPPLSSSLFWLLYTDIIKGTTRGKLDLESIGSTEYHSDKNPYPGDISIYNFFAHRMQHDFADYYVDPFVRGIYASDCRNLSMAANFPNLLKGEQQTGSLTRALTVQAAADPDQPKHDFSDSYLVRKAYTEKWASYSFDEGLQTLPDRLRDYLYHMTNGQVELYAESTVKSLTWDSEEQKFTIRVDSKDEKGIDMEASSTFCALPAQVLSQLVSNCPDLSAISDPLSKTDSVTVAVVNLEFAGAGLISPQYHGFGFLVSSREKQIKMLGTIFNSCVFPKHDAEQEVLRLTVMLGGDWCEEHFGVKDLSQVSEDQILKNALEGLYNILGLKEEPTYAKVNMNHNCIPQYRMGHKQRLDAVKQHIANNQIPLKLIGASFGGQAVNECIYSARKEVESYLNQGQSPSTTKFEW